MIKILLVEDDENITRGLSQLLLEENFAVKSADTQKKATALLENESFDIVLLDIILKEGHGFSLCPLIKEKYNTPVIFLTASSDEYSVVTGLDMGADDYIEKPYRPRELISRIKSVLRRTGKAQSVAYFGSLSVDIEKGIVKKSGTDVFLSALEYRLFLVFLNNPDSVLTRERLLMEIWDTAGDFVNDNTLTVYIKRLRDKIEEDPQNPKIICTVRGLGYKLGKFEKAVMK